MKLAVFATTATFVPPLHVVILLVAIACFIVAAISGYTTIRGNWLAVGLIFFALNFLFT